jgi:hypothetical protein
MTGGDQWAFTALRRGCRFRFIHPTT